MIIIIVCDNYHYNYVNYVDNDNETVDDDDDDDDQAALESSQENCMEIVEHLSEMWCRWKAFQVRLALFRQIDSRSTSLPTSLRKNASLENGRNRFVEM